MKLEYTDSHKKKLPFHEVISVFLHNVKQPHDNHVMLAAILTELNHPAVKYKQIGNTIFEWIEGEDKNALVKGFNADTSKNFAENIRKFFTFCKEDLKFKNLLIQYDDPTITRILNMVFSSPPFPELTHEQFQAEGGGIEMVIGLGN
jgi:hypothetical protein